MDACTAWSKSGPVLLPAQVCSPPDRQHGIEGLFPIRPRALQMRLSLSLQAWTPPKRRDRYSTYKIGIGCLRVHSTMTFIHCLSDPPNGLGEWALLPHFTDEEAEVQELNGQTPQSHRWSDASQDLDPSLTTKSMLVTGALCLGKRARAPARGWSETGVDGGGV